MRHKFGIAPPGESTATLKPTIGLTEKVYAVSMQSDVVIKALHHYYEESTVTLHNHSEKPIPYLLVVVRTSIVPWDQLLLVAQALLKRFIAKNPY